LAGSGRGVLPSSELFVGVDFSLSGFVLDPDFFLLVLDLAVAEGVLDDLAEGFARGDESSSSSESLDGFGDFFFVGELFFVSEDSEFFDFDFDGVLVGCGEGDFFFFGDAVGVGVADFE
jgi:hypothetical protein